jgi:hypothetical protein
MKYKIIFSIIGIFLLLSVTIADEMFLNQREANLTTAQKTPLLSKNINDIATTKLNCKDDYCSFWITKDNIINSEIRVERYKEVCTEEKSDENRLFTKVICVKILKSERELLEEKTSITDKTISSLADSIIVNNQKSINNTNIGTDEKILIGSKQEYVK